MFHKQVFQPSVVGVPVKIPTASLASTDALGGQTPSNGHSPGAPSRIKAFSTQQVLSGERTPVSVGTNVGPIAVAKQASVVTARELAMQGSENEKGSAQESVISMTDIEKANSQVAIFKSTYNTETAAPGKVSDFIYHRQCNKDGSKNSFVR